MLKIRLQRIGKKKKPAYRFVVSESSKDMYGKHLEILGHYNPFTKVIEVKKDRILYWISVGAQSSPTVHNLLVDQNVIEADKVKASKARKKKKSEDKSEEPKVAAKPADESKKPEEKGEEKKEPAGDDKKEVKPEVKGEKGEEKKEEKPGKKEKKKEEPK